jgi:peptidoglycan/LPS O-acetylase OafA/YrhL
MAISTITGQLFEADFFRYSLYLQNLFHQANQHDYFPVAWSLSVEEWFYVTFPLLVVLAAYLSGRADNYVLWGAALLLIGLVTIAHLLAGSHDDWDQEVRRVTVFRIDSIAVGFCLFLFMDHFKHWTEPNDVRKILVVVSLFVVSAVIAFLITQAAVIGKQPIAQMLFPFGMALFGTLSVATFLQLRAMTERHQTVRSLCLYLGRISYSTYLFHLLLIMLLQPSLRDLALPFQLILFVGCLLLFSSIFYAYFERPILASRLTFAPKDQDPKLLWYHRRGRSSPIYSWVLPCVSRRTSACSPWR